MCEIIPNHKCHINVHSFHFQRVFCPNTNYSTGCIVTRVLDDTGFESRHGQDILIFL